MLLGLVHKGIDEFGSILNLHRNPLWVFTYYFFPTISINIIGYHDCWLPPISPISVMLDYALGILETREFRYLVLVHEPSSFENPTWPHEPRLAQSAHYFRAVHQANDFF